MKWTEISAGDLNTAEQRIGVALGNKAGSVISRISTDPVFVKNVTGFMTKGGIEPSMNQKRAREIMGDNFFGIEDAVTHLHVNPSRFEIACLKKIPTTDEQLEEVKETHVLAAVFSNSILEIRANVEGKRAIANYDSDVRFNYNNLTFAVRKGYPAWRLVSKWIIPVSTNKLWKEQQMLLGENEETPTARVTVYAMAGYYLMTGEMLFCSSWARCLDSDLDGRRRVAVRFCPDGVAISCFQDDCRDEYYGLASIRKFD
jgi:hypothetical protein